MSKLNLNLPFIYTYSTRIKTCRGLVAFVALEVLPLILVTGLTSLRNVINILLLFTLWLDLYEIGYLFNDLQDKTAAGELDRIQATSGNWRTATISRLLLALGLVAAVAIKLGWHSTIIALFANALLLATLLAHSSKFVRRHFPLRIVTFSFLALYRYAPILIPALGVRRAEPALITIFLFYGIARILAYVLRKFGGEKTASLANPQLSVQLGVLAMFAPMILIAAENHDQILSGEVLMLWLYFLAVALIFYSISFIRRQTR